MGQRLSVFECFVGCRRRGFDFVERVFCLVAFVARQRNDALVLPAIYRANARRRRIETFGVGDVLHDASPARGRFHPSTRFRRSHVGAKGALTFLQNLPAHSKVHSAGIDATALKNAIEHAQGGLANFAEFLERDLLPRSSGVYAVGLDHYELLLRYKHFLEFDAQTLLGAGEELFARTKRELIELTAAIAPGKSIEAAALAIQKNHPSTTEVLFA